MLWNSPLCPFAPRLSVAVALVAGLSACTTQVTLPYLGGPGFGIPNPVIAVGMVTDNRGEKPTYLGEVRNGLGGPLKVMETAVPVANLIADDFAQALAIRGLLASSGTQRYDLDVTLVHLDSDQMARREAHADFALSLRDRATGTVVYADEVDVDNVNGSLFTFEAGAAGSVPKLHELTVRTVTQAINLALDKPGFLAAISARP